MNNSNSLSSFIQKKFPTKVDRHLLPCSHTNMFNHKSINYFFNSFGFELFSEWWFGQDFYELINILNDTKSTNPNMQGLIESSNDLQRTIDRQKFSDRVIYIFKKKINFKLILKNIHISFLRALIVSIIVCISPSNMLGYLSPFLFLLVLMFSSKVALNYVFKNSFIFLFFVINLLCFYKFLDNSYVMGNGFLSILTYGSFIPVLLLPSKFFTEQKIITKISKIILVIIIIESLIGIIQSIYGFFSTGFYDLSNGDFVEGTIHPNLESEKSMSNPIFAIILSSLLIFILAFKDDIKFSKPVLSIGFFTFFSFS